MIVYCNIVYYQLTLSLLFVLYTDDCLYLRVDSKTEKVTSQSPGRGILTNKWVPKPKIPNYRAKYICVFNIYCPADVDFLSHFKNIKSAYTIYSSFHLACLKCVGLEHALEMLISPVCGSNWVDRWNVRNPFVIIALM